MLSPDGEEMCRCAKKRAAWYLDRDIAEIVSEDPPTIRLKFTPNGYGNQGDAFSLAEKHNRCVVCGTEENLTKHHIVPSMYRKFFPIKIKSRSAHDVVVICIECHDDYEMIAWELKKQIDAELTGSTKLVKQLNKETRDRNFLVKLCKTMKHNGHMIPEDRKAEIMSKIEKLLGRAPALAEMLELSEISVATKDELDPGKIVVEKILENDSLEEFVMRWRQHFIDTAKPKFMPEHWNVERKLVRE